MLKFLLTRRASKISSTRNLLLDKSFDDWGESEVFSLSDVFTFSIFFYNSEDKMFWRMSSGRKSRINKFAWPGQRKRHYQYSELSKPRYYLYGDLELTTSSTSPSICRFNHLPVPISTKLWHCFKALDKVYIQTTASNLGPYLKVQATKACTVPHQSWWPVHLYLNISGRAPYEICVQFNSIQVAYISPQLSQFQLLVIITSVWFSSIPLVLYMKHYIVFLKYWRKRMIIETDEPVGLESPV